VARKTHAHLWWYIQDSTSSKRPGFDATAFHRPHLSSSKMQWEQTCPGIYLPTSAHWILSSSRMRFSSCSKVRIFFTRHKDIPFIHNSLSFETPSFVASKADRLDHKVIRRFTQSVKLLQWMLLQATPPRLQVRRRPARPFT